MDKNGTQEIAKFMNVRVSTLKEIFSTFNKVVYKTTEEIHKLVMAFDPSYARKFRHLRKYQRMYARGGKKRG